MHLALNKVTHDLFKPEIGGLTRVDKGRFIVQQVQCKLRAILGEWVLNPSVGFINTDDMEKNFDLFDLETRALEIILKTEGVLSVDSIDLTYKSRKLFIHFTAKTRFGHIDTTIPWDNILIEEVAQVVVKTTLPIIHQGVQVTFNGDDLLHTR